MFEFFSMFIAILAINIKFRYHFRISKMVMQAFFDKEHLKQNKDVFLC